MKRYIYEILTGATGITYQLPIFLEAAVDEMGIMVGFDGEIEQVEQFCNFTYRGGSPIAPSVTPSISVSSTPGISVSATPSITSTPTVTPSTSHIPVPVITLWAVGGDFITKSINSGQTWTQSYDTVGTNLNSISFLNINDGFAFGGTAKAFKTINGGTSWFDDSASLPGTISTRVLFGATKQLSSNIYVGGNLSAFIRYNGSTWSDVSKGTSHNAYDLYAFSNTTVLSITSLTGVADYGLRTTNSGSSWSEPATFPQDKVVTGVDFYGTSGIMCSARNSTIDKIFRSSDSGQSWSSQVGLTVDAMQAISFPTATVAYMVGGDQASTTGKVWKTTNGGTSWTDISGNLPATTPLRSVKFFDQNIGWAGNSVGNVLYTTNGGTSWTSVNANVGGNTVADIMMIVQYI